MIDLSPVTAVTVDGDGSRFCRLRKIITAMRACFRFNSFKVFSTDPRYQSLATLIYSPCNSIREYNDICLFNMAEHIDTDFCLIFHDDGFPLFPQNWSDEFLTVDYIGAPWEVSQGHDWARINPVGNGGFSLRSKQLLDLVQNAARSKGRRISKVHEDGVICIRLKKFLEANGCVFANYDLARKFSIETILGDEDFNVVFQSFGFHDHNRSIISYMNERFGDFTNIPNSIFTHTQKQ